MLVTERGAPKSTARHELTSVAPSSDTMRVAPPGSFRSSPATFPSRTRALFGLQAGVSPASLSSLDALIPSAEPSKQPGLAVVAGAASAPESRLMLPSDVGPKG